MIYKLSFVVIREIIAVSSAFIIESAIVIAWCNSIRASDERWYFVQRKNGSRNKSLH